MSSYVTGPELIFMISEEQEVSQETNFPIPPSPSQHRSVARIPVVEQPTSSEYYQFLSPPSNRRRSSSNNNRKTVIVQCYHWVSHCFNLSRQRRIFTLDFNHWRLEKNKTNSCNVLCGHFLFYFLFILMSASDSVMKYIGIYFTDTDSHWTCLTW